MTYLFIINVLQYLDENKSLILKIVESQNSGKLSECAEYVLFQIPFLIIAALVLYIYVYIFLLGLSCMVLLAYHIL